MDFFKTEFLAILGLIGMIFFYFKSQRIAKPRYHVISDHPLQWFKSDDEVPEYIEIRYKNKKIPRLSVSFVRFWNAGTIDIEGNQARKENPLRVELDSDGEILETTVYRNTNPSSGFTITIDQENSSKALIDFKYLTAGHGVIFGILHTDKSPSLAVKGEISNCKIQSTERFQIKILKSVSWKKLIPKKMLLGKLIFWSGVGSMFMQMNLYSFEGRLSFLNIEPTLASIVLAVSYVTFGAAMIWHYRRRYPANLVVLPNSKK